VNVCPLFVQVGNFLKNMATFVAGFVVGFSQVWQLTLVLFAIIPLLATPGMLYARTLKGLSSQGAEAYSDAGDASRIVHTLF
jgi:ATP-binding cassette subfamily B (MDR/TAP) protein 1